jgi:7-cyano-7-deazaguanine reductase
MGWASSYLARSSFYDATAACKARPLRFVGEPANQPIKGTNAMPSSKKKQLQLGRPVPLPASPEAARLERVQNPHRGTAYVTRLTAPEFTSLCPVTGQPDFAHIVIDYVPGAWLVESKSLKLYLGAFRNHGAFHEDCTVRIGRDLARLLKPKWLRIGGYWYPRGGIPIDIFWQTGTPPRQIWLPDQGVAPYRGRG